jgi:hypothetical protein
MPSPPTIAHSVRRDQQTLIRIGQPLHFLLKIPAQAGRDRAAQTRRESQRVQVLGAQHRGNIQPPVDRHRPQHPDTLDDGDHRPFGGQ